MKKAFCFFGKHDFKVIRNLGYKSQLIHCVRCKGNYGVNHDVRAVLPFDKELYEMYTSFGQKGLKKYISTRRFAWYW